MKHWAGILAKEKSEILHKSTVRGIDHISLRSIDENEWLGPRDRFRKINISTRKYYLLRSHFVYLSIFMLLILLFSLYIYSIYIYIYIYHSRLSFKLIIFKSGYIHRYYSPHKLYFILSYHIIYIYKRRWIIYPVEFRHCKYKVTGKIMYLKVNVMND